MLQEKAIEEWDFLKILGKEKDLIILGDVGELAVALEEAVKWGNKQIDALVDQYIYL